MKKTLLITGGLGYIGSIATIAFAEAGYEVVIVDNLDNSCLSTYRNIGKVLGYKPDFYEVDIRDLKKMEEIFSKYKFDGVIHFAGLKAVGESCEMPLKYFDNNIIGSIRLFELMQKYEVRNLIFSSSATVYNGDNELPYKEEMSVGETSNPYGTTKFLIEKILEDLAKFSDFRVVNLRYFNPIGAHTSSIIGENSQGIPNNLFPFIMKVVSGELAKLEIFGGDYDTVDGTGVRDYIDVNDLVEGHLKAYDFLRGKTENGFFETFNLGVGRGISVLELVKLTEKVIGKKIPYDIIDKREGDLASVYCEPSKAKEILNWEARTSIEDSVRSGVKFMEGNK